MIALQLPPGPLSVQCLGAHPDDIEIGCGGALLALAARQPLVGRALVMTGTSDRVAETRAALGEFLPGAEVTIGSLRDGRLPGDWDAVKNMLHDSADPAPDIVFAPRPDDAHQDHRLLGELAPTVWRDSLVLHYEIPKRDGDFGQATHYVPLPDDVAARKVRLLNRYFPSQHGRDWWDDELFFAILRLRGMECRTRYAEAFVLRGAVLTRG